MAASSAEVEPVCPGCGREFAYETSEYNGQTFKKRISGAVQTDDGWKCVEVHRECRAATVAKLRELARGERSAFLKSGNYRTWEGQRKLEHKEQLNGIFSGLFMLALALGLLLITGGKVIGWGAALVGVVAFVSGVFKYLAKVVFWNPA